MEDDFYRVHVCAVDVFLSSTKTGHQFQRDLENLMESYLDGATQDEKESCEKAARERNKKVDQDDTCSLWNNLHHNLLFKVEEGEMEAQSEQFWKHNASRARPITVRAVADFLTLDSSIPLDQLRPLIYRQFRKLFAMPYDPLNIDLLTSNCGSCPTAFTPCCCNLCQHITGTSGNSTTE